MALGALVLSCAGGEAAGHVPFLPLGHRSGRQRLAVCFMNRPPGDKCAPRSAVRTAAALAATAAARMCAVRQSSELIGSPCKWLNRKLRQRSRLRMRSRRSMGATAQHSRAPSAAPAARCTSLSNPHN